VTETPRTVPSEHHHIRFTIDSGGITPRAWCTAPEGADCRSWCHCDNEVCGCEEPNITDRGECGRILFLTESDPIELYSGPNDAVRDGEIALIWDGSDTYTWRYLDQMVIDHRFDDGGIGMSRCYHIIRPNRWARGGADRCELPAVWHTTAAVGVDMSDCRVCAGYVRACAVAEHECPNQVMPGARTRSAAEEPKPEYPCKDGFQWGFAMRADSCEACGRPAWDHSGIAAPPADPFGDEWGVQPWPPGVVKALRAAYERELA
jgi:hypothetical protein